MVHQLLENVQADRSIHRVNDARELLLTKGLIDGPQTVYFVLLDDAVHYRRRQLAAGDQHLTADRNFLDERARSLREPEVNLLDLLRRVSDVQLGHGVVVAGVPRGKARRQWAPVTTRAPRRHTPGA